MSPCLDDLVRDPARAGLLSSEERQALLAQVVVLLFALGAPAGGDRLLTVTEAADKLRCAPHTLYRNKRHPARVQNGRSVRFSERAIETFIRQHRGRGHEFRNRRAVGYLVLRPRAWRSYL